MWGEKESGQRSKVTNLLLAHYCRSSPASHIRMKLLKQNMGNNHSQTCLWINDIYNVSFCCVVNFWNNLGWCRSIRSRLIRLPSWLLVRQTPPSEAIHSIINTDFSCFACRTLDKGKFSKLINYDPQETKSDMNDSVYLRYSQLSAAGFLLARLVPIKVSPC